MGHRDDLETIRVFVISPHRCIAWGLERLIETRQPSMTVAGGAATCAEASDRLGTSAADVVLLDLDVKDEQTADDISTLLSKSPAKVVILTGSRDESIQREAILAGACGIVRKEQPAEAILSAIEKVHEGQLWLDRTAMSQILSELARRRAAGSDPEKAMIEVLTRREKEVVTLAASRPEATGKTLARMLNISERTLRNHLSSIYDKLDVSSRVELYAFSHKHGMTKEMSED